MLVDDQDLIRAGLVSILAREPRLEVVGEATTGSEAIEMCERLRPDLVLMDIEMPEMDGLSATREIKQRFPTTSVLVLTGHDEPDYLLEAVRAGAAGFLLKDNAFQRVTSAIERILNGESPLDQELAMKLLGRVASQSPARTKNRGRRASTGHDGSAGGLLESLTERESEILERLASGSTNQEIAEELFLSVGTVKTHVHHIISKLGVSDRTQAVVKAIRLGLVSP